jgi:hypothetical protein
MAKHLSPSFEAVDTDPARWTFRGEWSRLLPQREQRRLLEQLAHLLVPERVLVDVRDAYLDSWGEARVEKLTDDVEQQGGRAVVLVDGQEEAAVQTLRRRYARRATSVLTSEAEAMAALERS